VVVLPPHSVVAGKTAGEWSADWWQWALGFSTPGDPFTDPTGASANLNQSGPVFFLAGTAGGAEDRSFTAPAGKYLLAPLLVGELSQLEIGFDKTAAEVRQAAKDQADLIDELHATFDGAPVSSLFDYREVSPDFTFVAAPGNPIGVPAGDSGIAVADGYFLMLAPLSPGTHVLNFGGGISSFDFSIDVTDTIASVPEPATLVLFIAGVAAMLALAALRAATLSAHACPTPSGTPSVMRRWRQRRFTRLCRSG
jgi:hypothetical protein